jgi:flagellar export protein FliJ
MSKPKKGKRFNYPLEALLKVREIREKQQQEAFNKAEKKLHKERLTEARMKKEQDSHIIKVHEMLSSTELPSLTTIQMNQQHVKVLEKKVNEQKEVVVKAEEKRIEERDLLIEKAKEKKIIQKDREKTRTAWKKMMDKLDAQFLDELSSIKFASTMIKKEEEEKEESRPAGPK